MSTAALPQLQVLLDNAHSFPAPTPPNAASTSPSESPDRALSKTGTSTPPILDTLHNPTAGQKQEAEKGPRSRRTNPFDLNDFIKPPPTPRPWLWQCHRCYTEYRVSCTRRCFECGHEFCTAVNNSSKRGPCKSQFDFAGWEAWGSYRRTLAHLKRPRTEALNLNSGTGTGGDFSGHSKRRKKGGVGHDNHVSEENRKTRGATPDRDCTFATLTLATETIHDLGRGWIDVVLSTKGKTMPWQPVTAEERDAIMKRKEKMYVRREYDCWVHCDAPSECRLAVYIACYEGRAKLVGNGKLTAVLLEDMNPKRKGKQKAKKDKNKPGASSKLVSKLDDSDDEKAEEVGNGQDEDKECVIMKKLRRKKNQLLYGSDGRTSERKPSTEITTEHVEDRQAEHELPAGSVLITDTKSEERTPSVPRQVIWPAADTTTTENDTSTSVSDSDPTKPRGLLATLISGTDSEIDLGTLPFEKDHNEEEPEDVEFAELVRVSSNLAQSTGNIASSSSGSSATALVSPPPPFTSFTIIRIDEADHPMPSTAEPAREPGNHASSSEAGYISGSTINSPPPNHQPPQQTQGFVDMKEVINIGYLQERPKSSKKRQRSEEAQAGQSRTPTTSPSSEYNPNKIFCPSPITFKIPVWKDEEDNVTGQIDSIVSEYSAADLMDILSETESFDLSNVSSAESSPASSINSRLDTITTTMRDTIGTSFTNGRQPLSPDVSPTSVSNEHGQAPFSPASPLSPECKMNNDLSMYLDDEIMSPVSIAAARTMGILPLHLAEGIKPATGIDEPRNSMNGDDKIDEIPITLDQNDNKSGSKGKDKENQCEVLLTLRKMQSAFMGGRQEGRLW